MPQLCQRGEVRYVNVHGHQMLRRQAGEFELAPPLETAHRHDAFHRARPVMVFRGAQESVQNAVANLEFLALLELGCMPLQEGIKQEGSPDRVQFVLHVVGIPIGALHVDVGAQPAHEVGLFRRPVRLSGRMPELLERPAGPSRKHVDAAAGRMRASAVRELAVLYRRQEVAQPSQRLAFAGRVELIPEHQRRLALELQIANLVEGARQFLRGLELGQVESHLRVFVKAQVQRDLFNREGFSRSGRAEDRHGQRSLRALELQVLLHGVLDAAHAFDLVPIRAAPLADRFDGHIGKGRLRTFAGDASGAIASGRAASMEQRLIQNGPCPQSEAPSAVLENPEVPHAGELLLSIRWWRVAIGVRLRKTLERELQLGARRPVDHCVARQVKIARQRDAVQCGLLPVYVPGRLGPGRAQSAQHRGVVAHHSAAQLPLEVAFLSGAVENERVAGPAHKQRPGRPNGHDHLMESQLAGIRKRTRLAVDRCRNLFQHPLPGERFGHLHRAGSHVADGRQYRGPIGEPELHDLL
ncbi:MAG TPA: hypothetical protein VN893_02460 [Bryobacteraceae bacterium]|nr:hypothetical protein [Bryobacteraceae bacterium]